MLAVIQQMVNQLSLIDDTCMKRSSLCDSQETIIDIILSNGKNGTVGNSGFIDLLASADFIDVNKSSFCDDVNNTVFLRNLDSNREISGVFRVIVDCSIFLEFLNTLWRS